jgi:predicted CXXCH cytochrome family protein
MDCATCHDPHSASLKKVAAPLESGDGLDEISQLCINCHKESSMNFPYTSHHKKGVSCVDCHVNHLEDEERTAHTVPDHSFNASLQSCNTCHAQQMHSPLEATGLENANAPITTNTPEQIKLASVTPEPESVSPVGFSVLAGMIGLAGGMVLAPWLERWYRHLSKHDPEDTND